MPDALPDQTNHDTDVLGVLRIQLEHRLRECARLTDAGVEVVDPATTYVQTGIVVGAGTIIEPNTTIRGASRVGANCRIGPNSLLADAHVGDRCVVYASVIEGSTIEDDVHLGPFSHLRGGTHIEAGVHLGNFVEVNRSRIGRGSKMHHFGYIGDGDVGEDVNIGAGTVTCNFDGVAKHRTVIEDGAFIGSDSMLVAPLHVGKGAATGAGSVVTQDIPDAETVAGVPARPLKGKKKNV